MSSLTNHWLKKWNRAELWDKACHMSTPFPNGKARPHAHPPARTPSLSVWRALSLLSFRSETPRVSDRLLCRGYRHLSNIRRRPPLTPSLLAHPPIHPPTQLVSIPPFLPSPHYPSYAPTHQPTLPPPPYLPPSPRPSLKACPSEKGEAEGKGNWGGK